MGRSVLSWIKSAVKRKPIIRNYVYGNRVYRKYIRSFKSTRRVDFLISDRKFVYLFPVKKGKAYQLAKLFRLVQICPVENRSFFYSIDCCKAAEDTNRLLDNYTVDIACLVKDHLHLEQDAPDDEYAEELRILLDALRGYLSRCREEGAVCERFDKQLTAIGSLFERPAESFFEALQRILFYNQFLWQTGHTLNGLGHLDWILDGLYRHDLKTGVLTRQDAKELIKDFFRALHEYYWFKSAVLVGDTGQIIILGGRAQDGKYRCNDLTYLFIEAARELRMPDPKVLLRCTADMPEDLLEAAINCIATGIGAPLLSNDDAVIPAMRSCGYEETDVYNYGTSACWEPLVPGMSCEANNIASLNFAVPFTQMLTSSRFDSSLSLGDVLSLYEEYLARYIRDLLTPLTKLEFEQDPLLSLASPSAMERHAGFTRGGAKYNGLGLTSVGLGTVVNSLLNLQKLVFSEKHYTLRELDDLRKEDFAGHDTLLREMKDLRPCFGCDDDQVVELTKGIIRFASGEFGRYQTKYGGRFKFGLSSPGYISDAAKVPATFDGRRSGDPFSVHISCGVAVPTTELLSFAMKLDYNDDRLNGNVIDFITSPGMLTQNVGKYAALLRAGFAGGIFQLQMNVVDSKTLIAAKADPTLFPNLVVRVWGFSAYFNDLPEAYKDVLIARAIESEKVA